MCASQDEIAEFLKEFKRVAVKGRGLDIIPPPEKNPTIVMLGLTEKNVKDEILRISVEDYCDGPLEDKDKPGYLWAFGRTVYHCEIYIKLKLANVSGIGVAKCISFHIAEFPMKYPYK